jgi:hypothetical protein
MARSWPFVVIVGGISRPLAWGNFTGEEHMMAEKEGFSSEPDHKSGHVRWSTRAKAMRRSLVIHAESSENLCSSGDFPEILSLNILSVLYMFSTVSGADKYYLRDILFGC